MALKTTSKRILISDESINTSGFVVLTKGIDLSQYEKNPLMLFMHFRPLASDPGKNLPLGIVTDLKVENGALTGQPQFDDQDAFAMTIYQKFEADILRMSSAGLSPVAWSDDKKVMKAGQTFPTLTKSRLKEVSICDLGRNDNALSFADVVLYDDSDAVINLSDPVTLNQIFSIKKPPMHIDTIQIALISSVLGLTLTDTTTEADIVSAVTKLKTDKDELTVKLADLERKGKDAANLLLVDEAVLAKKILPAQKSDFLALADKDYDLTKSILDKMTAYVPVQTQLADLTAPDAETAELIKMSAQELWSSGKLTLLKDKNLEAFKVKYQEFFNKPFEEKD